MRAKPGSTAWELSKAAGCSYQEVIDSVRALQDADVGVFGFNGLDGTEFSLDEE